MFSFRRFRWLIVLAFLIGASGVNCVQAVSREAQFGGLDGVNGFAADSIHALLEAIIPSFKPAD